MEIINEVLTTCFPKNEFQIFSQSNCFRKLKVITNKEKKSSYNKIFWGKSRIVFSWKYVVNSSYVWRIYFFFCFSARVIPFTIGFVSDDTEVLGTPAANAAANEQTEDPGGIVGFQLMYYQQPC